MAKAQGPSPAVLAARARREANQQAKDVRLEWYIKQVTTTIRLTLKQRVKLATHLVKTKVVTNISRPVTKTRVRGGGRSRTVVSNRSRPGEFPKVDTTQLMKSIFEDYKNPSPGVFDGYIGTPLDYGVILELYRDRSFLKRTLREQSSRVVAILVGPNGNELMR